MTLHSNELHSTALPVGLEVQLMFNLFLTYTLSLLSCKAFFS